jgi:hypothetical protein
MKYKIEFQHKEEGHPRPSDEVGEDSIQFEGGEFIPIPNVGDSVCYQVGDKTHYFKVETRHFSYLFDWCVVNIVVTDITDAEMAARLKN